MPSVTGGKYIRYNNKLFFVMSTPIALDGSTSVPVNAVQGSIGVTTNATGKSYFFVSNGSKWIANGGAVSSTAFADITGAPTDNAALALLLPSTVTVDVNIGHTDILTLPTIPYELLPAPGTGKFYHFLGAILIPNWSNTNKYTNVANDTGHIYITAGSNVELASVDFNSLRLFGHRDYMVKLESNYGNLAIQNGFQDTGGGSGVSFLNSALVLTVENSTNGNFTGGNASNILKARLTYEILDYVAL